MKCPQCKNKMERKKRPLGMEKKETYYFTEWDYCKKCRYIKHYEKFKRLL